MDDIATLKSVQKSNTEHQISGESGGTTTKNETLSYCLQGGGSRVDIGHQIIF